MREDNDYIDSHESADDVTDDHDPVTSPPIAYDPQAPAVVVEPKESLFRSLGPSKQSLVLLGFFIALIFVGGVTESVLIQIVAYGRLDGFVCGVCFHLHQGVQAFPPALII